MTSCVPALRLQRVQRHGADPIALSTLQPDLRYLDAPTGYVAYQRAYGVSLSLGGPVCGAGDEAQLARDFMRRRGAALFYVPEALARSVPGFRTCIGADRVLDLRREDTFSGKQVASAVRKAAKARFSVDEAVLEPAFVERVTAKALERSVVDFEMRFLNRPMSFEPGPARTFVLSARGEAFGYAVLDPYFENGRVKGYLLNMIRFERTSLWGVYFAAVEALGRKLAAEGVEELSLGFCPLRELDFAGTSWPMRFQLRALQRYAADSDYVSRLYEMKRQLEGSWRTRWLVTRTPQLVTSFLALLELTGA